jgi:ArsR family transcriptional regulator, lead/cadmium/zinc/bismuth-responsive transcriptional repressor
MKKTLKKNEVCEQTCIHTDTIKKIQPRMPEDSFVYDLSDFFKVLGDSTRVRILHALSLSEMCVCDLACLLDMNQSAVSHQLKVLKMTRLVKSRKDGKVAYYMLADEHVRDIFECGAQHISERK